ncbi:MAG: UDP-N-acetylmuramoyl-L-alanine--D-glutamate ligase, partial [Epsilonproteobacteria bacterium]
FLQDALLALAVSKVLFDETDYALMNTFRKDAHRQEEFLDAQGRIWVNDSKATNVAASIQALKTYDDKHIHLILGGDDKDADLNPLFEIMQTLQLTLYTIGANNTKLLELAKRYRVHAISSQSIENAVQTIASKHSRKSLALLSPAAASFDQFTSYKARGETFVDLVKKLKDN